MSSQIVLISDDSDFFDFIKLKLELRKSDKLKTLSFDEVPEKIDSLQASVLIVNSENCNQKTIDLLKIFNYMTPVIVTAYNDDETFKKKCYRAGTFDFIPLLTSDSEFRARMLPALNLISILKKNNHYRNLLVKNKVLSKNNEVYINYENTIDSILAGLKESKIPAVFAAISPNDKDKYLINPNSIETFLINNIRKNDILMKFAHNKYYLIMFNTDLISAEKHWNKIIKNFNGKLYAGFINITNQNRQQLISNALFKLNEAFNSEIIDTGSEKNSQNNSTCKNFKLYRKEREQKYNKLVTPVFYRLQQKYMNRLIGVKIEQDFDKDKGSFNITGKHFRAYFNISSPGFSKVNIDITIQKDNEVSDSKKFSFDTNEFDENLLEDLLEQFISETKNY